VEARSQAGSDVLHLVEYVLCGLEEIQLILIEARKRVAGAGRSAAHAGIYWTPSRRARRVCRVRCGVLCEVSIKEIETPVLRYRRRRQSCCPQHDCSDTCQ